MKKQWIHIQSHGIGFPYSVGVSNNSACFMFYFMRTDARKIKDNTYREEFEL